MGCDSWLLIGLKNDTNTGMIPARSEREEDASEDDIIVQNVSPGSLSPQVYVAALQGTEAISFLKLKNEWVLNVYIY